MAPSQDGGHDSGGSQHNQIIMKKILFLIIAIPFLASAGCASVRSAAPADTENEESINIGYGKAKRKNTTNSISHVKNDEHLVYNSIYDYLRDKVPGVVVERSGSNTEKVYVRGVNSINSPTDPLFIVDGVEVDDISAISPYDVESVDVLKDSAASIYGVRGTNGVIIITLKRNTN